MSPKVNIAYSANISKEAPRTVVVVAVKTVVRGDCLKQWRIANVNT